MPLHPRVRMPILRYSAPLFPSNSCIRFAAASVSSMTCFVDLIVDCLAVDDEDDAAACVIARLSIRVVNMERMLSRKDTCSLSFFLFCKGGRRRRRQNSLFLLFYSLLVVRLRRAKSGAHDDLVRAMKMMNAWYTSEYDFLLLLLLLIIMKIFISSSQFLLMKLPRPPKMKKMFRAHQTSQTLDDFLV